MVGQPWPELELPWEPMGSSPERGRRAKGKRGGAARGAWHGEGEGRHGEQLLGESSVWAALHVLPLRALCS
jgi:hypothetical protein